MDSSRAAGKEADEANSSGPDVEQRDPKSVHKVAAEGQHATDA